MLNLEPQRVDRLLETLTGVVRARVRASGNGEKLAEIHILSDGELAPKQIVRNVETLLKTAFDVVIDHRIVSIAVLKEGADVSNGGVQVAGKIPQDVPVPGMELGKEEDLHVELPRVVFQKLRMVQEEPFKCTAYVELKLGDVIFEGVHQDTDTPQGRMFTSARAVIEALEYLGQKEMAFYLAGLERLRLFQREVVVALVEGRRHREKARMLGSATVEDDASEAAVRAVLDAVNRFITRPGNPSIY